MDNVVITNSSGFHDRERLPAGETSTRRILVVGDSFTAGLHVPTENVWTHVLEKLANDLNADDEVEVVNLGIDGTGTDIHRLVLEDNLPVYAPDAVILAFYENDIGDMERPKLYKTCYAGNALIYQNEEQRIQLEQFVDKNTPNSIVSWLFDNFYTFRLPVIAIKKSGRRINSLFLLDSNYIYPSAVGVSQWHWGTQHHNIDDRLTDLRNLAEEHDFELMIIPVPTKEGATGSLKVLQAAASEELLGELNVIDVSHDLEDILNEESRQYSELFWRYDGHFNSVGNEYFGRAIFRALQNSDGSLLDNDN